jgi:hypothetical protein
MDLAPMALYNALRYNLPDLPGCTLVIDLGARSTNLVFSEGDRVFCRSIPIAGHTISAAIAKEFEQDLVLAEKLKIEKGQVGLGGAYAEPADPTEARIAKVVRNTMTRLHSEISRSINFYRTNHNGNAPDRILLAGGNAKLTYATDFFAEKLNAPVDFFNPLQNIEVQPGALPEGTVACASGIGELVGLALRSLKNCPVELNLTPPSVVKAMDFRRRIPSFALAGLLLILTPALWFGYFTAKEKSIRARTSALVSEKNPLEQTAKEIREGLEKQKILAAAAEPFLTSVAERTIWPNLIEELAAKMPSRHIWITKLTPVEGVLAEPEPPKDPKQPTAPRAPIPNQPTGKPAIVALQVDGLYLDNPPNPKAAGIVDEFVTRLDESPFFNTSGDRTKIITQRTTPTGETWAYGYTLVLPLKTPVPLP